MFCFRRRDAGVKISPKKLKMAFILDVPYLVEPFSTPFDDFHGECEDCGKMTPEWRLDQCQYGFCGRFFCRCCGFRCVRCDSFNPRSVSLCSAHARISYPQCNRCNQRFCDECTNISVKKCTSCLVHVCSKCLEKEYPNFGSKTQLCKNCNTKIMRSLQEICRASIRRSLGSSLAGEHEELHPREVDKNVQHLPLPSLVKNFMCFE